jgi:ATP-dependent DNA helicase RecG
MNKKELKKLLSRGETETVEFKENPSESLFKNISAFANAKGGTIVLGVDKNGNITGTDSSTKFLEDFTNRIVNKLSLYPELETINIGRKRVIIFRVTRSNYPISYEGRYYERVGNTTREISAEKLRALLLRGRPWDSLTDSYTIREINSETLAHFSRYAVEKREAKEISIIFLLSQK